MLVGYWISLRQDCAARDNRFGQCRFPFLCGSIVLWPCLLRKGIRLRGKDLWLLVLASVIGVPLQFLVQFAGLRLTTVSHASLIVGTLPMLLALSSALFFHERLKVVESGALLGPDLARFSLLCQRQMSSPVHSQHQEETCWFLSQCWRR
jgi:hypothetical protein